MNEIDPKPLLWIRYTSTSKDACIAESADIQIPLFREGLVCIRGTFGDIGE